MTSAGDESGLTNMLGYGDANSSRGDISFGNDSPGTDESRPVSAYSVHQAVSTPRRQSHRPAPRRHSPQVTTPQRSVTNDENSPDFAIAFTPGKTKLNTQSLLALQRKFGSQQGTAEATVPLQDSSPRGLRASDSTRNAKEGSARDELPGPPKGPSILKSATPTQSGTPRASLIPRPSGNVSASFKRKVVVTFASSPVASKSETPRSEMPVGEMEPQTPCNSSRRALAGHTPGYVPPRVSESPFSEVGSQVASTRPECGNDEHYEDQMSSMISCYEAGAPASPEVETPKASRSSSPVTEGKLHNSDIFCGDVSTVRRPPSAPLAAGGTPFYSNRETDRSMDDDLVPHSTRSGRTSNNDSATPSTLFYSSSGSEACKNSPSELSRQRESPEPLGRGEPAAVAVEASRPAPQVDWPRLLAPSPSARADLSPAAPCKDLSIMSTDSSPLDFSKLVEPDFYRSIGLEAPEEGSAPDPVPAEPAPLDYDMEFLTRPTRHAEATTTLQRHRGSASAVAVCIGSPAHAVPALSRRKRAAAAEVAPPASVVQVPLQQSIQEQFSLSQAQSSHTRPEDVHKSEKESCPAAVVVEPVRTGEVSLSRPGLRRPKTHTPAAVLGGCLSDTDKKKSVPFMISSSSSNPESQKEIRGNRIDNCGENLASMPDIAPVVESAVLPTVFEERKSVIESTAAAVDINVVCKEVFRELYADQNDSFIPPADLLDSADSNSCLGLNELIGPPRDQNDHRPQQFTKPRTIDRAASRRVQTTPSTCSSGWSLGTTAACRVPTYSSSAMRGKYMFSREDDDDAPAYYEDETLLENRFSPANPSINQNDSFASQNTMTTVAIDDDQNGDGANDGDNIAQLCLTSRPWYLSQGLAARGQAAQRPPEDVKEILLFGKVGYTTVISISFRNKRSRGTVLQAKAILHRFEPTDAAAASAVAPADTFRAISENINDESGAIDVAPDDTVNITVEFSPFQEGIYSGVLKIRSKKKAFVLLLRGEAASDCAADESFYEKKDLPDEPAAPPAAATNLPQKLHCAVLPESGDDCCDKSSDMQRRSLRRWLRTKLETDSSRDAREKLKETYDRARYLRLLSLNSPSGSNQVNTQADYRDIYQQAEQASARAYFRKDAVNFGTVSAGSILRLKVELCNPTDHEVQLRLGDPMLPFIVLHNEISVPPHSFIRIPVRFVPVYKGTFSSTLYGQILDTDDCVITIQFSGTAV